MGAQPLPPRASRFGCRRCYNLSYASRNASALDRSREKARGIRLRLGGSAFLADPFPFKPRRMWQRTYDRLQTRYKLGDANASVLFGDWIAKARLGI